MGIPVRPLRRWLVAVLLAVALPVEADPRLDAYVAEVLQRHPGLQAEAHRAQALAAEARAEGRWPDPELEGMVDNWPEVMGQPMPMVRVTLRQMVMTAGKLGGMRAMAEARAIAGRARSQDRRLQVTAEARKAWIMLAMNSRRRDVNRRMAAIVAAIAKGTRARYAAGTGGHHDLARAEVERNGLEVEHFALLGERRATIAMLNALRDRPPEAPIDDPEVTESAELALDVTELATQAVAQRPDLQAMVAMQREMQAMTEQARRERWPDVMTGLWLNQMFDGERNGGVMVGTTLPVISWGRQALRAEAGTLRVLAVREDLRAMQAMARYEVADAVRQVETAGQQVAFLRKVAVRRAKETFDSALASYAAGAQDLTALQESRRAWQVAELALVEAVLARESALAELERVVGGPVAAKEGP